MGITLVWMTIMVVGGTWWVRRDITAYAWFKTQSDTVVRQRFYGRWFVESLVAFVVASTVSLWLAGGLWPFTGFPDVFAPANRLLQSSGHKSDGQWLPMALGLSIGIAISVTIQWRRLKTMMSPSGGLDQALIPRNRREGVLALLLSLNAGFSEELFFRLALPMLLFHVTNSLVVSFSVSMLCFGLAHAHYGWKGIVATTAIGGLLTFYYLNHGSLLRVMIAHATIDVLAFFVRPAIADWIATRRAPQWAVANA